MLDGLSPFPYYNLHINCNDFAGEYQTSVATVTEAGVYDGVILLLLFLSWGYQNLIEAF